MLKTGEGQTGAAHITCRCRSTYSVKVYNYILNHIFVTYIRGWGGLLVARLHYLLPHLSYILVDLASIAAPSANFLMVFQVVSTTGVCQILFSSGCAGVHIYMYTAG